MITRKTEVSSTSIDQAFLTVDLQVTTNKLWVNRESIEGQFSYMRYRNEFKNLNRCVIKNCHGKKMNSIFSGKGLFHYFRVFLNCSHQKS